MWEIAGVMVPKGVKMQTMIRVPQLGVDLPVTLIHGSNAGKTVLITSGIHGNEPAGIVTGIDFANGVKADEIHGRLIMIHVVNPSSFWINSDLSDEDGKNLNRVFPPDEQGSYTDKLAAFLWKQFQCKVDFHLDLHGCGDAWLEPHGYYVGVGDEETVALSRQAAKVAGGSYIIKSTATSGAYNYAGINGIPGLLLERGECGYWDNATVKLYLRDVRNVLRVLGILESQLEQVDTCPIEVQDVTYLLAEHEGLWRPCLTIDQPFHQGQALGEIVNAFGETVETCYANMDGVGLYMNCYLHVQKGDFLFAYGRISRE